MADRVLTLLNGVSPTIAGTFYSNSGIGTPTSDYRDFAVMLLMPTTTGTGADSVIITLEESPEREFTNDYKIRTLALTNPSTGAITSAFATVLRGTASPNALLQQKFNLADKNYHSFIRAKYVVAGTATSFTNIFLQLLINNKI